VERYHQPPGWLEAVAWASLAIAFVVALFMLYDFYVAGRRQHMWIMEAVYPLTALYWGPAALWFYLRHGRDEGHDESEDIRWYQTAKGVTHCGAGCTAGDVIGEWIVFSAALTIAGKALYADFAFDFALAWLFGVAFQYFSIVPMRDVGRGQGLRAAIKADTLSIVAFQIGLFAGMALYQEVIFPEPLPKTSASYWLFMQLSMILGFFTAYPVNAWLIRIGWKEKM
jgi:hypothetical protein